MIGTAIRRAVLRTSIVVLCAVMLAPIIIVVVASFGGDGYMRFPPRSVSLRWYAEFLADPRWLHAFINSLLIASLTCLIATSIGFLAAYALVRGSFSARRVITALLLMPMVVPQVVTSIALYFVSARLGLIGIRPWIAVAHGVLALPVVLVVLQAGLRTVDPNLERAAMICGCSRAGVLRSVILPLVTPSLLSALLFSFLTSFDELLVSLFLAGVRSETLPMRIWNSLTMQFEPTVAAVSSLLIAVTCLVLAGEWALRRRRAALEI